MPQSPIPPSTPQDYALCIRVGNNIFQFHFLYFLMNILLFCILFYVFINILYMNAVYSYPTCFPQMRTPISPISNLLYFHVHLLISSSSFFPLSHFLLSSFLSSPTSLVPKSSINLFSCHFSFTSVTPKFTKQ